MSLGNKDDNGGEKNEYCSCTASLNIVIHFHVIILLQYTVEYNVIQLMFSQCIVTVTM